jgi:hypothetical protein
VLIQECVEHSGGEGAAQHPGGSDIQPAGNTFTFRGIIPSAVEGGPGTLTQVPHDGDADCPSPLALSHG